MTKHLLEFKYTKEDYLDFLEFYVYTIRRRRNLLSLAAISIGILLIFWYLPGGNTSYMVYGVAYLAVFIVLWWVMFRWMVRRNASRVIESSPQFWENRHIELSESAIEVKGETFSASYTWHTLQRFDETKHSFLLFSSPYSALIIPKRACPPEILSFFQTMKAQWQKPIGV